MGLKLEASFVLSGGTGALGVVTAQTLVEEVAKLMVLLSRSGKAAPEAESRKKWLPACCVDISAWKCDIGDARSAESQQQQLTVDLKKPTHGVLRLAGFAVRANCSTRWRARPWIS